MSWRIRGRAVAALLIGLAGCGANEPEDGWHIRATSPGAARTIATEGVVPDRAWNPRYLAYRDGVYFISDRVSTSILMIDDDGAFVGRLGAGAGAGPGEFRIPAETRPLADATVWTMDQGLGRLMQFSTGGDVLRTIGSIPSRAFGILGDGAVVFFGPHLPGGMVLADGRAAPISVDWSELMLGPASMLMGMLAAEDGAGGVLIVDNVEGGAWLLDASTGAWTLEPIQLPGALTRLARQVRDRRLASVAGSVGGRSAYIPLFQDLTYAGESGWWLSTGWSELLGLSIDPVARAATLVIPSEAREHSGLKGSHFGPEGHLTALYEHELVQFTLEPAEMPSWIGIP
jgi:hypothetical protein